MNWLLNPANPASPFGLFNPVNPMNQYNPASPYYRRRNSLTESESSRSVVDVHRDSKSKTK